MAERSHKKGRPHHNSNLPRFDQALLNAKNTEKRVKVYLALELPFADDDCTVEGFVLEVDKFMLKLDALPKPGGNVGGGEVWLAKSFIVATRILQP